MCVRVCVCLCVCVLWGQGTYPQPPQVLARSPLLGLPEKGIKQEMGKTWHDMFLHHPPSRHPFPGFRARSPWESVPTVKVTLVDA